MPTIAPRGGAVTWPEKEGVIGVVGVAPWATLDFCKTLYAQVTATKDWHYPRVIADINTKIPSRGRHFELGEEDPSPFIAATIDELHAQGATVVVVACNTAHVLYDRWAANAPVPVPHIVAETVASASAAGAMHVCPLTSTALAKFDLYGRMIAQRGLRGHRLQAPDQAAVSTMIEDVKQTGVLSPSSIAAIENLSGRLRAQGVEACLLGCTELSALSEHLAHHGLKSFDSNVALASACLRTLQAG